MPGLRRGVRAGSRSVARAVVRRVPARLADRLRRPLPDDAAGVLSRRARLVLLRALREGGIPAGVTTFRLADNPEFAFVAADSLVLPQLYWYGEQGWEPELVPWWRHCCRQAESVLELGANVG